MKKLMILGGSRYAVPVIEVAHKLGLYVITCDYLPDNIAHKFSDEYCNVSIIDKEATYEAAKRLKIDGIVSFACDPGVATAAYIAEKMGLPFQCSYRAAEILQDKGLFRQFLTENGFNCPHAKDMKIKNHHLMILIILIGRLLLNLLIQQVVKELQELTGLKILLMQSMLH